MAVPAGGRATVEIPVADLYTHTSLTMPVHVVNGRQPGPTLFISAAVHGDEINGVEIIRRLLKLRALRGLRGALIAVPIVNVFGFLNLTRYLPDRRDLNRAFPGSERGSVTARLANLFAAEIVAKADCGIDLHTGAVHRANLPQIRADLDEPRTRRLAEAFGVPVLINATVRDGSLREFTAEKGIPMLLYEAGEALRFDEVSIRAGLRGILRVMRELGMLPPSRKTRPGMAPVIARSTSWIRAPASGIVRTVTALGAHVKKNEVLGVVSDPFGESDIPIAAPYAGLVIGCNNLPLSHEGDALYHVARFESTRDAARLVARFHSRIHGADR
ncbi:succinylglutamate desuccinylase/aspartoacylase family protein [soil metagenome]